MKTQTIILKSLVGSRAHGLHTDTSDYDYRGVHVYPTREILGLFHKYSPTAWLEGDIDETSYEIGHFLQLCTKANPSVMEVLLSEETKIDTPYAQKMRDMLPLMYNPKDAFNAFAGYSKNQQKKLLENHLDRREKFGVAYVRTSYNLVQLFETGTFSLKVKDQSMIDCLTDIRAGKWTDGQIVDKAERDIKRAKLLLPDIKNLQDLKAVEEFLLHVRKDFW